MLVHVHVCIAEEISCSVVELADMVCAGGGMHVVKRETKQACSQCMHAVCV